MLKKIFDKNTGFFIALTLMCVTGLKANPIDINQLLTDKGYRLEKYQKFDITNDGTEDYIAVGDKQDKTQILIIDGTSQEILGTDIVVKGDEGCILKIHNVKGNYQILYLACSNQPSESLFEFKDGKLINNTDFLNEKFKVEFPPTNRVRISYPNSVFNQMFSVPSNKYISLVKEKIWYTCSYSNIKNDELEIVRDIIMPGINDCSQLQVIEQYKWNGTQWLLNKVNYSIFDKDFKKVSNTKEVKKTQDVLELIGQGSIDTIPYKVGDPISNATKVLGQGKTMTLQGVMVHTYGKYTINESLYQPTIVGYFIYPGFKLYGITIGDNSETIKKKLGYNVTRYKIENEELAPSDAVYYYSFAKNGNELIIFFNKNNKSNEAIFLCHNQ